MKKFMIAAATIPGFIVIFLTSAARQLIVQGNLDSINKIIKGSAQLNITPDVGDSWVLVAVKLSENAQLIYTFATIWILAFAFLYRREMKTEHE